MAKLNSPPRTPPESDLARLAECVRVCEVSRASRQQKYRNLRSWYESGSADGSPSRYNKLFAHINVVGSFIFSPGTVRFGVHLPPQVRKEWMAPSIIARDEFRQLWEESASDTLIDGSLEWSLVYGGTIVKVQPDYPSGFRLGYIQPWDFGVSREDVRDLDDQDTICHWYTLSLPQIERWVGQESVGENFLAKAKEHARPMNPARSNSRLVISSITGVFPAGQIAGGFPQGAGDSTRRDAEVDEPTVEFVDLWERRMFRRKDRKGKEELFEDWHVTTCLADNQEPLVQRRNPDLPATKVTMSETIPAELPFVSITPRPIPDYFWGRSELDNLTMLQDWLEDHLSKIKGIVGRQLNPPRFFSGVADFEEAGRAMDTEGGSYGSAEPGAKMDAVPSPLSPEALKVYEMILGMFSDISGVPGSITEPASMPGGVRSTGHFGMAAGIGAGRLRKMALTLEKTLAEVATKSFHCVQRTSTELFRREDGTPFLLSQIPHSVSLSVNAHSSSPIFSEQTQAKASLMMKAGVIAGEDFVELLDPPNRDEYKARAKILGEQKAEMSQKLLDIKEEKALKPTKGK